MKPVTLTITTTICHEFKSAISTITIISYSNFTTTTYYIYTIGYHYF